jgi:hypothetical protein
MAEQRRDEEDGVPRFTRYEKLVATATAKSVTAAESRGVAVAADPMFSAIAFHRRTVAELYEILNHLSAAEEGGDDRRVRSLRLDESEWCERVAEASEAMLATEPTSLAGVATARSYFDEDRFDLDPEDRIEFLRRLVDAALRLADKTAAPV